MSLAGLLRGGRSLGHFVWWTGGHSPADVHSQWARAGLPTVRGALVGALEQTLLAFGAVPVLERSGVFWLAPDFGAQLELLREVLTQFDGWELHTVPVRATADTLAALRASATHAVALNLSTLGTELEALLSRPRERASVLVRRLDALESLRKQAELHARHLGLHHEDLETRLEAWARRIDAALCARIVA
jgi:hypothetical protein